MRLRGEHFFSRFHFTHPGLVRILKTAAEHLALPGKQERRMAFERLARLEGINDAQGRPIRRTENDRTRASTLAMIARLSEAPLVSTQEERRLFELLFEIPLAGGFDTKMVPPSPTGCVPDSLGFESERDAFVIWAPLEPAWRTALAVNALEGMTLRVIVVCNEGTLPNVRASFVRPETARHALARARAVLDLAVHDPGDALELARLGLPLAVSYLSGAYELLSGVAIYRPWMQRDIEMAALTAWGLSAPRKSGTMPTAATYCEPAAEGPPVAIAGRTGLEGQTYTNIAAGRNAAYVAEIPPGAVMFETHVASLVEALERSGADRAVSDGLMRVDASPGYALVNGAFVMTRNGAHGQLTARVQRATGVLSA